MTSNRLTIQQVVAAVAWINAHKTEIVEKRYNHKILCKKISKDVGFPLRVSQIPRLLSGAGVSYKIRVHGTWQVGAARNAAVMAASLIRVVNWLENAFGDSSGRILDDPTRARLDEIVRGLSHGAGDVARTRSLDYCAQVNVIPDRDME